MSAYVKYGSYSHAAGEVELVITEDILETDSATPYARLVRWELLGLLMADTPQQIDDAVEALRAAYATNGQDLSLIVTGSDGATFTADVSIDSSLAVGGVRVISGPSFPSNRNAAYSTHLPYSITLEAEIPVDDAPTLMRSFSETISFSGGGPKYGILEPTTGLPVRQQLKQNTAFRAEQSGRAVGLYQRPVRPLPLWPAWLVDSGSYRKQNPRRRGSGASLTYTDYEIEWSYRFESPYLLTGNPHTWGNL